MSGSGKNSTSTSQVTIPPEVLQRYNNVNNLAEQVGQTPFKQYSTDPNAFVAPINAEQQGGINQTNQFATAAQPYNSAATGYTLAGGQAVDPSNLDAASIQKYLSPYLSTVLGSTAGLLNQNNQQQQAGQLGNAIEQGAFGGDRAGIAAANLEQQQNLGNANIYSGIANQGYNQALETAQQQQGVNLGAQQANRAALQQTGSSLANLGQTAQTEGLQGAQAEQAAGATQQQTSQAGLTALYNQFLQQQSYPFQVAQFEANVAEGTGALSGSTTTTTQPQSIFSDERLKEDVETIGKTFGGQNVVAFRYKGDPTKRIGLIAQDVEKKHPEAVSHVGGFKAVDYGKATDADAEKGHFYKGGLVPANDDWRKGYAYGGEPSLDPEATAMMEAANGTYGPYASGGLYGSQAGGQPRGGLSYVPSANLPVGHLAVAQPAAAPPSMLSQATQAANLGKSVGQAYDSKTGKSAMKTLGNLFHGSDVDQATAGQMGREPDFADEMVDVPPMRRGGLVHRDMGGGVSDDPYGQGLDIPDEAPKGLSLPVATPPKQDDSSGMGDMAKMAELALMFIPKAAGGMVSGDLAEPDGDPADAYMHQTLGGLLRGSSPEDGDPDPQIAPPGAPDPSAGASLGSAPNFMASGARGGLAPSQAVSGLSSLPTDLANTLKLVSRAEGTDKNPNSSARGQYQIIDPTFVGLFRQMFPEQAQGMSKADILALRDTPQGDKLSAEMGPTLAKQNIAKLQSAGFQPSAPNVYLAHFLGPTGAIRVLSADPATPMSNLVSPLAIAENGPIMKGKTAADVIGWAGRRLQQVAGRASGGGVRRGYADGGLTLDENGNLTTRIDPLRDDTPPSPPPGSDAAGDATANAAQVPLSELTATAPNHDPAAAPPPQHQSWQQNLRKPEVFIPLLTGLAAAAATPTVHPLMAIAEGLGAGAKAYQGQREYQLQQQQVAQHGQEVGVLQAQVPLEQQRIANERALAKAHATQANVGAATTMLGNLQSIYHPVAQVGPDGLPGYKDVSGNFISATDFGRIRAQYMSAISDATGLPPIPISGGSNGVSGYDVPATGGGVSGGAGAPPVPAAGGSGAVPAVPVGGGDAVGPALGGAGGQPAPGPGAAGASRGTLAQKVSSGAYMRSPVQLPSVDNSRLAPSDNPATLKQQGWALVQMGSPEQATQGHNMIDRATGIENGTIIPNDVNGQPYNGYVAYNQALGQQNAVQQSYAQQKVAKNAASADFSATRPQAYQVQQALNRIYGETDTNRLTPELADLVGKASSIPGLRDAIAPAWRQYQSTNDEAVKETAIQTMVQAAATHLGQGAPASTLSEASHTVPLPTMAPGARYDLAAQQLALLRMKQDYYRDWNANKDHVNDVASYDSDWTAEHPVNRYEQWAYDRITPFAGMTQQEKAAHPRHPTSPADLQGYGSGIPFVIPSGPNKGKVGWTP